MTTTFSHVTPREDTQVFPASFAQQRLWFLDRLEPNSVTYNVPITIRLKGLLDVRTLERSFNAIVQRHAVLRTTFQVLEGQLVQVITHTLTITLPVIDLQSLPETEREVVAQRLATEEAQHPFDLTQGPLIRTTLLQLDAEEHVLFLTLHNIIFDRWSLGVLFHELATLYEAFSNGRPSPLSELPIQYEDFAVGQQEALRGDIFARHLTYWKQLVDRSVNLDLPTDHPRLPTSSSQGSTYSVTLPKALVDALKELSRQQGVTLFMTLVAAFQTLLHRYTGQDNLVIGTLTSGRTRAKTQAMIGLFENTLALHTDLSSNPTFGELLTRVREVILEAQTHQDLPFEYLAKELQPDRQLGQNSLFQASLVLEPSLPSLPSGWMLTQMGVETGTSKFDLSLELADWRQGLISRFRYSTDLFDQATIARMGGHWQTLLEGVVADPSRHLTELPILTQAERYQLLVEWNPTTTGNSGDQCIHQLFETHVERTPDAVAVVFEDRHLTYRELNSKANQLAHSLQRLGVGPEVLVGLYVERSLEMIVALLGILKAGGAYVPLDPTYPSERIAFLLADTQASVLVTQKSLMAGLPEHKAHVICMDTDWNTIDQMSEENLVNRVKGGNLVYVIYTSGSTGKPKGVAVEHRQLLNYLSGILQRLDLPAGSSFATISTLATDLGNTAIFPALCTGGCLHVISRERAIDADALVDYFQYRSIDCLKITPSHLAALHALSQTKPIMPIRRLIIGGEASAWEWVKRLQALAPPGCVIFNHYGPTETTVGVLTYRVKNEQDERGYTTTPLGRPIANTQIYLLDQHRNLVPIGIPGEVYIGGASVARGYLNRPELTSERFIPNPFNTEPDARLYKTGDLARYLPNGNIEFLGRIDDQVKLRGFRIELGEIEAVLSQHPAVQKAVVIVREEVPGDKCLVAYVVLHNNQTATVDDLQSYMLKQVPAYMVPFTFVLLRELPLTANGKVDRRALPPPEVSRRMAKDTFVAPTLPLHHQLVQIWEDLLGVRHIGIRDNFFYLGGHSLLAARLINQIEQVFGKRIPLATLFTRPTIEQLADALQEEGDMDLYAPLVAVQTSGSRRPFFFLHGDYKGGAFYCFPLAKGLGIDQPFYALEPYQFDDLQALPTMATMATTHIQLIRTVQPEGPYLLGGFCNGGLVAYEVARQLHAQGETVDLLILINPVIVGSHKVMFRLLHYCGKLLRIGQDKQLYCFLWLRHMYRYLQHLYRYVRFPNYRRLQAELDPSRVNQEGGIIFALKALHEQWLSYGTEPSQMDEEQTKLNHRNNKVGFALSRMASIFPDLIFPSIEALRHDWGGIFRWSIADYTPSYKPGKSIFLFTRDTQENGEDVEWRKVAEAKDQEIEMYAIAGNQATCKTKHLHDFSERLRMCLSSAQKEQGGEQDA